MTKDFDVFAESEYYMLLLVDELKQKDENVITCFELFSRLKQEGKRIWVNIRGTKGELNNSFFISRDELSAALNNCFIVIDYIERGFYDKYYIVNCMNVINYQHFQKQCELIAIAAEQKRQEQKRQNEIKRIYGKQYNIFGGLD